MTTEAIMDYATREAPWRTIGTDIRGTKSVDAAMKKAGLDWPVEVGPLYGPQGQVVASHRAIWRPDNGEVLGVTGNVYQPFLNRDIFEFLWSLTPDSAPVEVDKAGQAFGGRQVYIAVRLDEDIHILDDTFYTNILFVTRHDGKGAIRFTPMMERLRCRNQIARALRSDNTLTVRHNGRMQHNLEMARQSLNVTTESTRKLREMMEQAAKYKVTHDQVEQVQTGIFGSLDAETSTKRRNAIEAFQAIYAAETALNGDTAYSVLNAITGYADHERGYQGTSEEREERRLVSVVGVGPRNSAFAWKQEGIKVLGQVVPDMAGALG